MKFIRLATLVLSVLTLLLPASVLALSSAQQEVFNSGSYYYDVIGGSTGGGGTCIIGGGTLPDSVPQPYNGIFTAAGNKFNVSPAFLAALFYAGEHGSSWPNPPPPYGSGSPWKSSGVASLGQPDWPTQPPGPGAAGPFQFEFPTWQTYQQDGNGDGQNDVEDLTDAAFGASKFLAALGAANTTNEQALRQAAARYNGVGDPNASYPTNVWNAFLQFSAGSTGTSGNNATTSSCASGGGDLSAYKNPLRDVPNLSAMRIDEGVDYGGDGPVYAIGSGKVVYESTNAGWPGGNYTAYTLSDGPAAGKTIYVAENCDPQVSNGQQVDANTVICQMHSSYPFIETGWSQAGNDLPMSYDVYHTVPDGTATAFGVNFSDLMQALGAPAGVYQYPQNKNNPAGSLPAGWPTWQ